MIGVSRGQFRFCLFKTSSVRQIRISWGADRRATTLCTKLPDGFRFALPVLREPGLSVELPAFQAYLFAASEPTSPSSEASCAAGNEPALHEFNAEKSIAGPPLFLSSIKEIAGIDDPAREAAHRPWKASRIKSRIPGGILHNSTT